MDFTKLFESGFRVREASSGREFTCVQMSEKFQLTLPDKFALVDRDVVVEEAEAVYDPMTNSMKSVMKSRTEVRKAKVYNPEEGHYHGGNVRGVAGDYILTDGQMIFSVKEKDQRGGPVFSKEFIRL